MRVIFEKGTPSAHINKNMHLECLSQNTLKLQTSVQEISFDEEQCLLIKNLILLANGYLSYLNLPNYQNDLAYRLYNKHLKKQ